jgi:pimeloyl-ACP methyl ester carboxylesterase
MKGQVWHTGTDQYHKTSKHCVLLIEGENDPFVPIEDSIEMIRLLRYAYLVVLSKGSHMSLLENSSTINKILELFISDSFSSNLNKANS